MSEDHLKKTNDWLLSPTLYRGAIRIDFKMPDKSIGHTFVCVQLPTKPSHWMYDTLLQHLGTDHMRYANNGFLQIRCKFNNLECGDGREQLKSLGIECGETPDWFEVTPSMVLAAYQNRNAITWQAEDDLGDARARAFIYEDLLKQFPYPDNEFITNVVSNITSFKN